MTTTVLNTKIIEVENKNPNVIDLARKTYYDAKISEIKRKYLTTSDYNKITSNIPDGKIKQKELVSKSDTSNLVKDSDINANYKLRLSHLFQVSWTFAPFYKSFVKTTFSFLFNIIFKIYPDPVIK